MRDRVGGNVMRTVTVVAILAVLTFSGARAENPAPVNTVDEWFAVVKSAVKDKESGIANVQRYRDSACAMKMSDAHRKGCLSAYNYVISSRVAEKAELEKWLKAAQPDAAGKNHLPESSATTEFNLRSDLTTHIFDLFWRVYTPPQKSDGIVYDKKWINAIEARVIDKQALVEQLIRLRDTACAVPRVSQDKDLQENCLRVYNFIIDSRRAEKTTMEGWLQVAKSANRYPTPAEIREFDEKVSLIEGKWQAFWVLFPAP